MSNYEIGVRKHVEHSILRYWIIINAKAIEMETDDTMPKLKSSSRDWQSIILQFTGDPYWKVFILFTIILNVLITINCFPYSENEYFIYLAVIVHLTCLFYWIDFCFAIALRCRNYGGLKERSMELLMADAISLVPLSLIYLLVVYNVNITVFWIMRCNTLIRFYRIHEFLGTIKIVDRSHWKTLVGTYAFYTFILIDIFANYWVLQVPYSYDIYQWNATSTNHFIICFYFSVVTGLNVGFGDIAPTNEVQILFCCLMMTAGFILTTGVITGAMTTGFANKEKKREIYRIEYESTMAALRQEKIDKHVLDKISDNLLTSWRHRKGLSQAAFSDVLPLSMQKEIYFDVNFGFLNRSLVFSLQPRSFLRSVSLMMRNMSFFPGDIILHPFGISEMMLCVASGVIEVLSEENDDTPLLSFTTGTIIGEASLFFSIPIKCIIRAATHVELQVLMKLSVTQMALKYPEIYRAMRADTFYRIRFIEGEANRDLDPDVNEISRRKATKRFIRELKSANRNNTKDEQNTHRNWFKSTLLQLYVLSENIPRTKTLPINLIKSKPWILRPDTPLIKLWDGFIVLVVTVVSFSYPYWMAFERKISLQMYVMLFLVEVVYITDLYIQCTTAIETNDHFTYIVSIKQIITHKLKTIGFYLDVLATYDFTIYTEFLTPDDQDYGYLLLSLNRILKFWHIPRYFSRLEDNVSLNLFTLRTIKYFFYYSIMVFWSGALLYFEACPGEVCVMERWYARLELNEVNQSIVNPRSQWPSVVSLYWGSVIISAEGYGDLVPKAIPDVWAVLVCIFIGAVIVTYCTAQASATMKHFVRHRTRYQEEVFAVNRFMSDHEIPKELQSKVRQYFRVQWNFDKAFSMKHHQQIHEMPAQQRDIILALLVKKLLTVPVFQNMDNNFLRLIAKSCKKRVLPPNEPVVFSGSYARELYILEQGYCEVTTDDNQRTVIGPLSPFGYVEMITGTPLEINVSTLTHACVVSLDYASYLRAVTQYPTIKTQIDSAIGDMVRSTLRKGQPLDILNLNPFPPETKSPNERALLESYLSKDFINVYKYHKALSTNYWEPFREWGKYRFFQFLLLPVVLSPSSQSLPEDLGGFTDYQCSNY
ncbi:hypothetical protein RUM44_010438 [Polyplax serrata]|uniref:Cyclic nucleotide-binding domain-containing protein n=1 Tax=Polyplax serrata TaxID=468196 RepID=A0ABR1AVK0_POLSC